MFSSPAEIAPHITLGHYVNGSAVTPAGGRSQEVFNPATGAVSGHVALGSIIDTDHWRHFYLLLGLVWGGIALEYRHRRSDS